MWKKGVEIAIGNDRIQNAICDIFCRYCENVRTWNVVSFSVLFCICFRIDNYCMKDRCMLACAVRTCGHHKVTLRAFSKKPPRKTWPSRVLQFLDSYLKFLSVYLVKSTFPHKRMSLKSNHAAIPYSHLKLCSTGCCRSRYWTFVSLSCMLALSISLAAYTCLCSMDGGEYYRQQLAVVVRAYYILKCTI
jgi:hypothetical protein